MRWDREKGEVVFDLLYISFDLVVRIMLEMIVNSGSKYRKTKEIYDEAADIS
jgi:hypothetical protein